MTRTRVMSEIPELARWVAGCMFETQGCWCAHPGPRTVRPAQAVLAGGDQPSASLHQHGGTAASSLGSCVLKPHLRHSWQSSPVGVSRTRHLQDAEVPFLLLKSSALAGATTARRCAQTASRHVTPGTRAALTLRLPLNPVSFPVQSLFIWDSSMCACSMWPMKRIFHSLMHFIPWESFSWCSARVFCFS